MPVLDIHELLAEVMPAFPLEMPGKQRLTVHDPCHLGRGQGLSKTCRDPCCVPSPGPNSWKWSATRQLLRIRRRHAHRPPSSVGRQSAKRATDLMATAAPIVVTGCPGCRMQIADALKRAGSDAVVLHTVQVMERQAISDCGMRNEKSRMTGAGVQRPGFRSRKN